MKIDAKGIHYKNLNDVIRDAAERGEKQFELLNVNGQRYIGAGIRGKDVKFTIHGTPGNDMAAFMNGPSITVYGNAQDGIGNTMNDGTVVVQGHGGDVIGYGMRGGKVFIRDEVGFRVGIHMKAYKEQIPVIVVGGTAGDFFGEYMAGGILVLLGLKRNGTSELVGKYLGTGMHGGIMYIRGNVKDYLLGQEAKVAEPDENDMKKISELVKEYCGYFDTDYDKIMSGKFIKIYPLGYRPYGTLYAY